MHLSGGVKTSLFVLVLVLALFQIGGLVIGVVQQFDRLSRATIGEGLWHLSQVEVDYRRLTTALYAAETPQGYNEIRHRFDLLYSRVETLREGESYAAFRNQTGFSDTLSEIVEYLNEALPYIDGDDAMLARELEMLTSRTLAIDRDIRELALAGVLNSSTQNEILRSDTRDILQSVFVATMGLIIGLILLVIILRRLYRQSRQISDENKRARARIASMIHAALDGILVTDPDGVLLEMNHAAERMFHINRYRDKNLHLSALIKGVSGADTYRDPARSGLLARGRVQTRATRKDGSEFPVEISLVQARPEKRSDVYVAFVRDISARLEAEDNLKKAHDKARDGEKAKTRLLAVMSHEIRTPLNGLLGAADLLKKTKLDGTQKRYVDAMQTSGDILERHVNDVLELSRLDDAQPARQLAPIDLYQLVPDIIESQRAFAQQADTKLDIHLCESVPERVMGDRQALQQVLLNLVGNAIKFTSGGRVSVEVDTIGQGDVIEFRVVDDGIGISDDDIDKIFEDFYASDTSFARRKQGTGLGLGITKRLVTAMDGEIGAESIKDEGSLFLFRLPMPPVNVIVPPTDAQGKITRAATPSDILLVEDNAINRMIATDMLRNAGHRVTQAENGVDGVAAAKSRGFDLILMDISMPDMDGLTAADLIRNSDGLSNTAPIIALTAHSMSTSDHQIKAHGITKVLRKPLTSTSLSMALEEVLVPSPGPTPSQAPAKAAPQANNTSAMTEEEEQHILNTDILDDVITNIGPAKARAHLDALQREVLTFTQSLQNGTASDLAQDAHRLAGAAAVLGLCALHRRLSKMQDARTLNPSGEDIEQLWLASQSAFDDHLDQFSQYSH